MASGSGKMNNRQGTLNAFMSVKKQGVIADSDSLKSISKSAKTPLRASKKQKLTQTHEKEKGVKSLCGTPASTSKTSPLPPFYPTTKPARANGTLQKNLMENKLEVRRLSFEKTAEDVSCPPECKGMTTHQVESPVKLQQCPDISEPKIAIGTETAGKGENFSPLLTTEKSACMTESTASAKTSRASDRYRHLVRKRNASPISSDDEQLHVPPRPVPKASPTVSAITFKSTVVGIKTVPGSVKYRHLVKPGTKLALPDKYDILERIFAAIEQTLVFNQGQGQNSVFVKIKKPVENICNRSFELSHLAQIVHIFPEAYHLQPVRYMHEGKHLNTVSININYHAFEIDNPKAMENTITESTDTAYRQVTFVSRQMEKRRRVLHHRLLELVRAKHDEFLAGLNFPTEPGKLLRQWHPDFNSDSVPDIPQATLPQVELHRKGNNRAIFKGRSSVVQARKIKNQAETSLTTDRSENLEDSIVTEAGTVYLESHCKAVTGGDSGKSSLKETGSSSVSASHRAEASSRVEILPTTPTSPATKQVSKAASLLERIRAKEKRRIQDTMFGQTPEQIHRKAVLSRLPQISDSISFYFISNKKNVVHLRDVLRVLTDSLHLPLSETEIMEHINLLCDIAPTWIQITTLDTHYTTGGGPRLVHLDRTAMSVKEVKEVCRKEMQKLQDRQASGENVTKKGPGDPPRGQPPVP